MNANLEQHTSMVTEMVESRCDALLFAQYTWDLRLAAFEKADRE